MTDSGAGLGARLGGEHLSRGTHPRWFRSASLSRSGGRHGDVAIDRMVRCSRSRSVNTASAWNQCLSIESAAPGAKGLGLLGAQGAEERLHVECGQELTERLFCGRTTSSEHPVDVQLPIRHPLRKGKTGGIADRIKVVPDDRFGLCARHDKQERRYETGSITSADAVDHHGAWFRSADCPKSFDYGGRRLLQSVEVMKRRSL